MGEITYQGESPYLMILAQDPTAHVSGGGVRMIVYASVHGKPPDAVEIHVPMTPDQARRLARELAASADPRRR